MIEQTLVLLKPDAVKRGLVGKIVSRFEEAGLKIIGIKMVWVDEEMVRKHYPTTREEWVKRIGEKTIETYNQYGKDVGEHLGTMDPKAIGEMVCHWLVDYLTSGPVVAVVLSGHQAISKVRTMAGFTHPIVAEPGTIRGDWSVDSPMLANERKRPVYNLIHASGDAKEAEFEIQLWFHQNELHAYKRSDEDVMFG